MGVRMRRKLDDLDRLIRNCASRLNKARDEVRRYEGELEGLLSARRTVFEDEPQLELPELPKAREISREWREILSFFLRRAPNPVSIDEVMQLIADRKFDITRN